MRQSHRENINKLNIYKELASRIYIKNSQNSVIKEQTTQFFLMSKIFDQILTLSNKTHRQQKHE